MPITASNAVANCGPNRRAATISTMELHEIRRENLALLIKRFGSQAKLAELIGIEPPFISQINTGIRNMGERFARDIEQKLNLPHGAMDQPGLEQGSARDLATLQAIISEVFDAWVAAEGDKSGRAFARFCVSFYRVYLETGEVPDLAQALRLRALLGEED